LQRNKYSGYQRQTCTYIVLGGTSDNDIVLATYKGNGTPDYSSGTEGKMRINFPKFHGAVYYSLQFYMTVKLSYRKLNVRPAYTDFRFGHSMN
jgi:hypothetical protein